MKDFNQILATKFLVFKCVRCRPKRFESTVKSKDVCAYNSHQISVRNLTTLDSKNSCNCDNWIEPISGSLGNV